MQVLESSSPVVARTRELCNFLVTLPELEAAKGKVDAFMADDFAKSLFVQMQEVGHELEHKQEAGEQLGEAEIARFEKARSAALGNDRVREFLDAQETMHRIHKTVASYVGKTLELGRVPDAGDFSEEHCGEGCGCHH